MGRTNQPRDRRGRWTETGAGSRLGSQRQDFARALQSQGRVGDNDGRSTVYAYLRDKDSPSGKAGSPYYVGVAGDAGRPYRSHKQTPVPSDERRIRMLRQDVTHAQAREWEKHYIQQFGRKDIGSGRGMLVNHTSGGEGSSGFRHSAESKAKMSAAQRGKAQSEEQKAKNSAAQRGRPKSQDHRNRIAQANRGRPVSAETREKIGATSRGRVMPADARARISAAQKGKPKSAETKARIGAARTHSAALRLEIDPSVYEKMSKSQRSNAHRQARKLGITYAKYVEKMRPGWGI